MPARKQIVILMTLWRRVCPLADAKENKYERLRWLAQQTGRIIDSANDLTAAELENCISALQEETRHPSRARQQAGPDKLRQFPNRSGITNEQLWKIRQLEHYLGWADRPQRLEGLLRAKFKSCGGNPKFLTHAQAWRLIEMLFNIAARQELRNNVELRRPSPLSSRARPEADEELASPADVGAGAPLKPALSGRSPRKGGRRSHDPALAAAVAIIKDRLQTWCPPEECLDAAVAIIGTYIHDSLD